jgi:hypothetical protein
MINVINEKINGANFAHDEIIELNAILNDVVILLDCVIHVN